jgi:hypothetical protein
VSFAWTQPVCASQLSAVQGLLSSQEIAARWHAPPEHMPSETWHMSVAVQALPSSFWQVPVALQALQAPQLALLQQTPSVQKRPAPHWSVAEQAAPAAFLPQTLPTQVLGATQSAFDTQVSRHACAPSQVKGAQAWAPPPTLQAPAPLHVLPSVRVDEPAGHEAAAHGVLAGYFVQAPAPLHLPSLPHVAGAETPHWPEGSALPAAMGEHLPFVAGSLHETQGPLQAVSQQTFSAEQTVERHSVPTLHGDPAERRPHEPLMQTLLPAQSALEVHVFLHAATPQVNGEQDITAGVLHLPAPSQVDWPVKLVVVAGHVASLHLMPAP